MKNSLGRNVLEGFKPYVSSDDYKNHQRYTDYCGCSCTACFSGDR